MNYIFDIVLNFHKNYYNFFEWNRTDKIKNIYKISIYRVGDNDLIDLKYNQIKVSDSFINKIKEDNPKYRKIICLVSNTKTTIGLLFDNFGNLLKRSSLLFEEETEANNISKTLPITKIEYQQNNKVNQTNIIRIEKEKKELLENFIKDLTDEYTLKYLYYEYFNEECDNLSAIKKILLKELDNEWSLKKNNLYQIINLLSKNKLPSK